MSLPALGACYLAVGVAIALAATVARRIRATADVLLLLERGGSHEEAAAFGVGRDLQRDRATVGLTCVAGERPAQVRRRADQRGVRAWADHLQKVLRGSGFGPAEAANDHPSCPA